MADVRIDFQYPATRVSGKPFDPATVDRFEIDISADGGANFVNAENILPGIFTFLQTELEPGLWMFRGRVIDNKGRAGGYASASIDTDDSPPGIPAVFVVSLV